MGWLSKILGIDSRRAREKAAQASYDKAASDAEAGRVAALQQAETTAAQLKAHQDALIAMQNNAAALTDANRANETANVSNVFAGGTADQAVTALKKKKPATSLSSALGINT